MTIRTKIVLSTVTMVSLALGLTVVIILFLLNQGIETQTRELSLDLKSQSSRRLSVGKTILHNTFLARIQRTNFETANICNDITFRQPLQRRQWKALFARMDNVCTKAEIDFIILFDTKGKVLITYPSMIDERYPETHFNELDLFSIFAPAVTQRDLTGVQVVSSLEKWDRKTLEGYRIECAGAEDILAVSAGIIPNDFMDEPIGYLLVGISKKHLSKAFTKFFNITGQMPLLVDNRAAFLWAGIKDPGSLFSDPLTQMVPGRGKLNLLKIEDESYYCQAAPLTDFFKSTIIPGQLRVSRDASSCHIIVGEPARLVHEANDKIHKEGIAIRNRVLKISLLISLFVLAITALLSAAISSQIAKPVAMAAKMSDKIASGNLDSILDETGTLETTILSKSMNLMTRNLKQLKSENEAQMKALQESENRFRTLFNTSHLAVALIEKDTGIFIDANERLFSISQYKRDEVIGKTTEEIGFCFEEDTTALSQESLASADNARELEAKFRIKDGSKIDILIFSAPICIKAQDFFLIEFYDITEKKHLESQLKQSLKMESIGTLAGGIAHDFNNILGIILGNAELALDEIDKTLPARENIETVKKACLKAAETVSQLLWFSRKSEQQFQTIDICPVISEALVLLRSSIPKTVLIQESLGACEIPVMADPVQINQIIMNLCINAYQAMDKHKGTIVVSTDIIDADTSAIWKTKGLQPGRYLQIDVSDNGAGIPADIMNRIFDPYFTTKPLGDNSGMGLAVVHGIVKSHSGVIMVESRPDEGTRFSVYLPVAKEGVPLSNINVEQESISRGTENILLVDDEEDIVMMFTQLLSKTGYRVQAYSDPVQALEIFESSPESFDLVISDMTMPEMSGIDLTRAIREKRSDIPIIICTGYRDLPTIEDADCLYISEFVLKPVVFKKFAATIRQVLDAVKI